MTQSLVSVSDNLHECHIYYQPFEFFSKAGSAALEHMCVCARVCVRMPAHVCEDALMDHVFVLHDV